MGMTMSEHLVRAGKFVAVLAVAVLVGVAITFGSALLGHEVLILVYAEDLAPIDDTLPMIAAVWTAYLAGIVSGLIVLLLGWRRFVRRPRTVADPR
jgi:O-antigen/teichoic acid export membrane protein